MSIAQAPPDGSPLAAGRRRALHWMNNVNASRWKCRPVQHGSFPIFAKLPWTAPISMTLDYSAMRRRFLSTRSAYRRYPRLRIDIWGLCGFCFRGQMRKLAVPIWCEGAVRKSPTSVWRQAATNNWMADPMAVLMLAKESLRILNKQCCIMLGAACASKDMKSLFVMISFSLGIFSHGYKRQTGHRAVGSIGYRQF